MRQAFRRISESYDLRYSIRCVHTTASACDKGMPMATNLIKAGHDLVVHDRTDAPAHLASAHGSHVTICSSPAELASQPDLTTVITMLPSAAAVQQVYTGPQGLLAASGGVTAPLLIDSSTIDPASSRMVAAAVAQSRLHPDSTGIDTQHPHTPAFVDAPVSGGVPGAAAGTLTFMCGGSVAAVEQARKVLQLMGSRITHCGGEGCGSAAKVCNNLVLGISMAAVSEGLALGQALGLEPKLLSDVFNTSSARCWSSDTYNPCPGVMQGVPSSRNYQNGFGASLMVKDLQLAHQASALVGTPIPMTTAAAALYQQVAQTHPSLDFSAVFQVVYTGGEKASYGSEKASEKEL